MKQIKNLFLLKILLLISVTIITTLITYLIINLTHPHRTSTKLKIIFKKSSFEKVIQAEYVNSNEFVIEITDDSEIEAKKSLSTHHNPSTTHATTTTPMSRPDDRKRRPQQTDSSFDFALLAQHFNRCELLFTTPPYKFYNMSTAYYSHLAEFNNHASLHMPGGYYEEGYTALIPEKIKALHYMAQAPFVRTICETGFNYGHSSFNFLTANPKAVVHSFDLGKHAYATAMSKKLKAMFPGRIDVYFGDSTKTVPLFIRDHPELRCDLMFVDGGHEYSVAKADLTNFISIASRSNIVILDDYPTNWGAEFGRAWEELLAGKRVEEKFRCTRYDSFERGFLAGVAVR